MASSVSNTSFGVFVENPNCLPLKAVKEEHAENLNDAIKQLLNLQDLVIIAKDGTVKFNRTLLSIYSPILKGAFSDMNYCGESSAIILPDCSIESIQAVLELIKSGFSSCIYLSFREYTHILETAKLLQIDLNFQNLQGSQNEKISFQNERSSQGQVKALTILDKKLEADVTLDKNSQNTVSDFGKRVARPKACDIQKSIIKKVSMLDQESMTNRKAKKVKLDRISGRDDDKKRRKLKAGLADSHKTPIETIWQEFFENPKISKEKCQVLTEELGFTREELTKIKRERMSANSKKKSPKDTGKNFGYKNGSNIDKSSGKISHAFKKKRKIQILTNETENTQNADLRKERKCKKSAYQLSSLRKEFSNNHSISIERAQLLSKELFLTEKQIRDWFNYQRSKLTNTQQSAQSKIESKSMDKIEKDNGKRINKLQEERGKLFVKIEQGLQEKMERRTELVVECNSNANSKQTNVSKIEDAVRNKINNEEINERHDIQYNCNYCELSFESKLLQKFHMNEDCIAKSYQDEISFMKQKLETLVQK